jgi:hypothetical protein
MAAAHPGCFSMALAAVLGDAGHAPGELDVRASCALDASALRIPAIELAGRDRGERADALGRHGAADEEALHARAARRAQDAFLVGVSTPSATDRSPRPRARSTIEPTIAASRGRSATRRTKEQSIFSSSTGRRWR